MSRWRHLLRFPGMAAADADAVSAALRREVAENIPAAVDPRIAAELRERADAALREMKRRGRYLRTEKPAAPGARPEADVRQFQKPRLVP